MLVFLALLSAGDDVARQGSLRPRCAIEGANAFPPNGFNDVVAGLPTSLLGAATTAAHQCCSCNCQSADRHTHPTKKRLLCRIPSTSRLTRSSRPPTMSERTSRCLTPSGYTPRGGIKRDGRHRFITQPPPERLGDRRFRAFAGRRPVQADPRQTGPSPIAAVRAAPFRDSPGVSHIPAIGGQ